MHIHIIKIKTFIIVFLAVVRFTAFGQTVVFPLSATTSAGGNTGEIQYNNSGAFGGVSNVEVQSGHIRFVSQPRSYAGAGTISLFAESAINRMFVDGPNTPPVPLQYLPSGRSYEHITGIGAPDGRGVTVQVSGATNTDGVISSGSAIEQDTRKIATSATGAASIAGYSTTTNNLSVSGSGGGGGFLATFVAAGIENPANQLFFCGLAAGDISSSTGFIASGTNLIGVGYDSGDANYSIVHNDGAGNTTKIDLGTNFTTSTASQAYLHLTLFSPRSTGSPSVNYRVVNLMNGSVATGTISADLPSQTTFIGPKVLVNNKLSGQAAKLAFGNYYAESY